MDSPAHQNHESKPEALEVEHQRVEQRKSFWMSLLPVIACGAGLFSDGYINNVRIVPQSALSHSFICLPMHELLAKKQATRPTCELGHRIGCYHPGTSVRRSVEFVECEALSGRYCLCGYGCRTAGLWIPVRVGSNWSTCWPWWLLTLWWSPSTGRTSGHAPTPWYFRLSSSSCSLPSRPARTTMAILSACSIS